MAWPKKISRRNECGHPERRHKAFGMCTSCYTRERHKGLSAWRNTIRLEKKRKDSKSYYAQPGIRMRTSRRHKVNSEKTWTLLFQHYGDGCTCCGERRLPFLTIDHIERNGNSHRKSIGGRSGYNMHRWLVNHGFPEGFRILCYNCNCGRERNGGICPHKENASGNS